jgi:hypothetical protein
MFQHFFWEYSAYLLAKKMGEFIPKTTRLACVVDFWLKPFEGLFDQFNNYSKYENLDLL